MDKLTKLYDSEINWTISTFWDGGYDAELGDELNGFKSSSFGFRSLEDAINFLWEEAKKHYPKAECFN